MNISFKNLGPIKEVDLDLSKKINLIVGHNGVGKTYLTNMVYGFQSKSDRDFFRPYYMNFIHILDDKIFKNAEKSLKETSSFSFDITALLNDDVPIINNGFIDHIFGYKEAQNIFKDIDIRFDEIQEYLTSIKIVFQFQNLKIEK